MEQEISILPHIHSNMTIGQIRMLSKRCDPVIKLENSCLNYRVGSRQVSVNPASSVLLSPLFSPRSAIKIEGVSSESNTHVINENSAYAELLIKELEGGNK